MTPGSLRSGELASRAGVTIQTLRYYERRGLLARPARSLGGHRLYPVDAVKRLRIIKAAQRLGFTLTEVATLLNRGAHPAVRRTATGPDPSRRFTEPSRVGAHLQRHVTDKIAEIDARVADLTAIRAQLVELAASRCDSLTDCTDPACPLPQLTDPASSVPLKPCAPMGPC